MVSKDETIDETILRCENLLNDVLKEELRLRLEAREKVHKETSEFLLLQSQIEQIEEDNLTSLHTQIDLGSNFYCQAKVPDTSKIFVHVGYGFLVEFTLKEASAFIEKKLKHLNSVADHLTENITNIKVDILVLTDELRKLQGFSELDEKQLRDLSV